MYAFCIQSFGKWGSIVPVGKDYVIRLRNKTRKGQLKETENMRKQGQVYVIDEFSNYMWNLSPHQLADYVMKNGKKLY